MPYLEAMAFIPSPVRPSRAWADLRGFLAERRRHEIVFAVLSVTMTLGLVAAVYKQFTHEREWQPPEITYVKQWPSSRTRVQIAEQQARDLPAERARRAAVERALAERRAQFQRVADRLGIDTKSR